MSIEGSLETVSLSEVLRLLADTRKTGELTVQGPGSSGRLWLERGELSGFEAGRAKTAADALFELLRLDGGTFGFEAGWRSADGEQRTIREPVVPALETAESWLAEWPSVVAVVPSLDTMVRLVKNPPCEEVVLRRDQWSLCVSIGKGRTVRSVLDGGDLPEFFGCRAIKELVGAGLVAVRVPHPEEHGVPGEDSAVVDVPVYGASPEAGSISAREALQTLMEGVVPGFGPDVEPSVVHTTAVQSDGDEAGPATWVGATDDLGGNGVHVNGSDDGLADRGPWTDGELSRMQIEVEDWSASGEDWAEASDDMTVEEPPAEEGTAEEGTAEEDVTEEDVAEEDVAEDDTAEDDEAEPDRINKRLLLKFLSSIRS